MSDETAPPVRVTAVQGLFDQAGWQDCGIRGSRSSDFLRRAEFAQATEIERERLRERNAELEQRLVEIVARKGAGTALGAVGALP